MPGLTLAAYLGMVEAQENGPLTLEVLEFLEKLEPLCNSDVRTVGKLDCGEIAKEIAAKNTDWARKSLKIAKALLDSLREHEYVVEEVPGTTQASAPTLPQEITIKQERSLSIMEASELIALCAKKPPDPRKKEAFRILSENKKVVEAQKRSPLAWFVGGKFDLARTLDYFDLMCDPYSQVQYPEENKGEKLETLAVAFEIENRIYLSPLNGKPTRGADEFGFNWPELITEESHNSALYALADPDCSLHPGYRMDQGELLVSGKGVWSLILRRYKEEKKRGNPYAINVKRYMNVEQIETKQEEKVSIPGIVQELQDIMVEAERKVQKRQEFQSPSISDDYYRSMVLKVARPQKNLSSHSATIRGTYKGLVMSGHHYYLDDVVCCYGFNLSGHHNSGTVILPPGSDIDESGHHNNIEGLYCNTWKEVAFKIGLLG